MTKTNSLGNAERHVLRLSSLADGLWEIYLGLVFTLLSINPITRDRLGPELNAVLILGIIFALAGVIWLIKKNITDPRIGVVRFSNTIKRKITRVNAITIGLVLTTFILLILFSSGMIIEPVWNKLPGWVTDLDVDIAFALIITGFFCGIGYFTGVKRFFLHGVLLGAGNLASTILMVYRGENFLWPIALVGGIITICGMVVLIMFLRDRPQQLELQNG